MITQSEINAFNSRVFGILRDNYCKQVSDSVFIKKTVYGKLVIELRTCPSRVYALKMHFEKVYFLNIFLCLFSHTFFCVQSNAWNVSSFHAEETLLELTDRLEAIDYPIYA